MDNDQWLGLTGRQEGEDALAAYRRRVMPALAIVGTIFALPFAVNNLLHGRYMLAAGLMLIILILCADGLAVHRRRTPPIPIGLLIVPVIGGISISLETQGFYGALWSYPVVLLFYFTMTRLQANIYSILLLLAVSLLVLDDIGADVAIRFFVTLTLTIILINIALNIIDDLQQRLVEQTTLDPLTGAFNRRHLDTCLNLALERNRRTGAPATLLLIDIDHFKRINDELGHAAGDCVLKSIVDIIRHRTRKLDLLFRIGGEEFMLMLPDTRESQASTVAEDIRAAVAGTALLSDREVTVSVGISELHPGESAETWLKHADDALYVAKNTGRDRVVRRTGLLFGAMR